MKACLGVCYRLRHVLWRAPYSTFDLALAIAVAAMGGYLLYQTSLFTLFAGVYLPMTSFASQPVWGKLFLGSGLFSLIVILWPRRPSFYLRMLGRMATAFCVLSFALNNFANNPPPVSAFFYGVLALFAVWAVLRVRCDGG